MSEEKSIGMAESFLKRAWNKLEEAKNHLKLSHYPESISASIECIELSMKAIFLFLQEKYPRRHEFKDEEFMKVLEKVPKELKYLNFPRLFLLSKFWLSLYTVAKYGQERFGIGPEKLFKEDEANLALKHAEECRSAASILESYVKYGR